MVTHVTDLLVTLTLVGWRKVLIWLFGFIGESWTAQRMFHRRVLMDIRPLEFGRVRLSMVKNIDISDAGWIASLCVSLYDG